MAGDELGELRRRLEAAEEALEEMRRQGGGRRGTRPSTRAVLIGVGLALLLAPLGVAATGDALREGIRNGTTRGETEIIGKLDATKSGKGGYVTRQSNTQTGSTAGGGAIYGCRGAAGGTAAGSAPCLRASNRANGLAFEFASKSGPAGLFEVGSASDAPFATNGTGLVTNLNADKVDGLDADQLRVDTSKFYDKGASDARFLGIGATAADADKVDGKNASALTTTGASSELTPTFGTSPQTIQRTLTFEVEGPGSRPVLLIGGGDVWSLSAGACHGFMQLTIDGAAIETSNAMGTAPAATGNNFANIGTTAMPTLAPGSHTVRLMTGTDGACIRPRLHTARLHAVVLDG